MIATTLRAGNGFRVPDAYTVGEAEHELGIAGADTLTREQAEQLRATMAPDLIVVGSYRGHAGMVEVRAKLVDASREVVAEATEDVVEAQLPDAARRLADHLRVAAGAPAVDPKGAAETRATWPARVEAMRHYALGLAAAQHEDWARAEPELLATIAAEPAFPLAHHWLGTVYFNLNDVRMEPEEARAFELAGALPERSRLVIEGSQYARTDAGRAIPLFRRAYDLDRQDLTVGMALVNVSDPAKVAPLLAELRALPPPASRDPNLDSMEGTVAQTQGHADQCVVKELQAETAALRADRPEMFLDARMNEIGCMTALGKLDEALALNQDALKRAATSAKKFYIAFIHVNECGIYRQKGDLAAAETECRAAMASIPATTIVAERRRMILTLADVLISEHKVAEAKAVYATLPTCTGAVPPCGPDRRDEGNVANQLGLYDQARAAYLGTLDAARSVHNERLVTFVLHDLALIDWQYLRPGDDALNEAKQAWERMSANPELYDYQGHAEDGRLYSNMYFDRGDFDQALALRDQVFALLRENHDDKLLHFSHGLNPLIQLMAGRPAEAEAPARDVLTDPSRDDARAYLVDALVEQGKLAEAEKEVAALAGNGPDAAFARAWLHVHQHKGYAEEKRVLVEAMAAQVHPIDAARIELRIARLAVAAGEPGAKGKLAKLAADFRSKGLVGMAIWAERESR